MIVQNEQEIKSMLHSKPDKQFAFSFVEHFRCTVLQSSVEDVSQFFELLAHVAREAFGAKFVHIWDNNVLGKCLVHLVMDPHDNFSAYQAISRTESLTGLAIECTDVVVVSDLSASVGKRKLQHPAIILKYGLTRVISLPVFNAFNTRLVNFVINLYFDDTPTDIFDNNVPSQLSKPTQTAIDWLIWSLSSSLDYLLYRMDDNIRLKVEEVDTNLRLSTEYGTSSIEGNSVMTTGLPGLFDQLLPEMKRLTNGVEITLFSYDPSEDCLVIERSTERDDVSLRRTTEGNIITTLPEAQQTSLNSTDHLLFSQCVDKRKPFLISAQDDYDNDRDGAETDWQRFRYMAVPVLSTSQSVLGVMGCKDSGGQSFSSFDLHALECFARAIGPCMERFLRLRADSILITAVQKVSAAMTRAERLDDLLQQTIDTVVETMRAETGSIYLLETTKEGAKKLIMRAGHGISKPLIGVAEYEIGEGITGTIGTGKIITTVLHSKYYAYLNCAGKYDDILWPDTPNRSSDTYLGVPIISGDQILGIWKVENIRPTAQHPDPDFTQEDVQMALVLSSFLAFAIENTRIKETTFRRFKLLADSTLSIEEKKNIFDATVAVLRALEESGFGYAMVSLYDPQTRMINGIESSWPKSFGLIERTKRHIASGDILAIALSENRSFFIPDSTQDPRCDKEAVAEAGINAQYVIPLRLDEELIGTLQVDMGDRQFISDDEQLMFKAFASHLTLRLSSIHKINELAILTEQTVANSRFIIAETLSGMALHSLGHRLDSILNRLTSELKRKEIRTNKTLLEFLSEWQNELETGRKDLRVALNFVKAGAGAQPRGPSDLQPEIQKAIDTWNNFINTNNCKVQSKLGAEDSVCRISAHAFREIIAVLLVNSVQAHAKLIEIKTYNEVDVITHAENFTENFIEQAFCLECSDNGIGLAGITNPEEIFDSAFTTKPDKFGTGLGLFIARRLARDAGGDIEVMPTSTKSQGVTFRLVLPLTQVGESKK